MRLSKITYIVLLILAGEAIFILPFVLARIFRPTVLEVFQLTNLELGTCYSSYGLVALVSYLVGGPLADRFSPRKLMALALWLTASGGWYYASYPSYTHLQILYGYWGFTTIFLFWAPMIKATRVWGGSHSQGKAFGLLDGGRGLVGALFGSLGILVFAQFGGGMIDTLPLEERQAVFAQVVQVCSWVIVGIGILVWFFLKEKEAAVEEHRTVITLQQIVRAARIPSVVYLMIIILCGYVGYKTTDILSQYAEEVMEYDQLKSATIGSYLLYLRPIVGIAVGFLADRSRISLWVTIGFLLSLLGAVLFASGQVVPGTTGLFIFSVVLTGTGVYAVRALYFACMKEGKIPMALTGTAVGLISLIGYTPDIFAGPMMGYLLDATPGIQGHQHVFWTLAGFSFVGLIASFLLLRNAQKQQ